MNTKKEIYYILLILNTVAKKHGMFIYEAYEYLRQYKGIEFLLEFYDIEHTLGTDDVVDDVLAICGNNGGTLV